MQKKDKNEQKCRHIGQDDCFITLATIMNIIKDETAKTIKGLDHNITLLEKLKEELVFLHKNYTVGKK